MDSGGPGDPMQCIVHQELPSGVQNNAVQLREVLIQWHERCPMRGASGCCAVQPMLHVAMEVGLQQQEQAK